MLRRWKKAVGVMFFYVRCKGKGVIQSNTEALDLAGERYREAIDDGVCGYGVGGLRANDQVLSLAAIEKVPAHLAPDALEAGGEGGRAVVALVEM